jgi:hypothetical protein
MMLKMSQCRVKSIFVRLMFSWQQGDNPNKNREPRFPEALKADAKHSASMTTILTIAVYA